MLLLVSCGGGGGSSRSVQPPPPPVVESVTPIQTATAGYCSSLPVANGGNEDLQANAGAFADTECGKYVVSCGDGDVNDMDFYAAVVPPVVTPLRGTILSFSGDVGDAFHAGTCRST